MKRPFLTLLTSALTLIPFTSQAQTTLAVQPYEASGQWGGFTWDGFGPASPNNRTGDLKNPNETTNTEVYFVATDAAYSVHTDWAGTISITGSAGASNKTNADAAYIVRNNTFWNAGPFADVGSIQGSSSVTFTNGGSAVWSLDFTGLANGYLPAGTLFGVMDLDAYPSANHLEGPLRISSTTTDPFLNLIFSGNRAGTTVAGQVLPTVTWNGNGEYVVDNTNSVIVNNEPSDLAFFITTQNLTSLQISSQAGGTTGGHNFRIAAPLVANPVPEPSSAILVGAAASLLFMRRKRH